MLNWLDILNEQAEWSCLDDGSVWLGKVLGLPDSPDPEQVAVFAANVNFIRREVFSMHFHRKVNVDAINEKLSHLRLEIQVPEENRVTPAFVAYNSGRRFDRVETLCATMLIQFARFVGDWLENPEETCVFRCEGLYKDDSKGSISPVTDVPFEIELQWRKEIEALSESGLEESPGLLRCADLFSGRKGRFCSDECRFRTFSITKQLKQPNYLAQKQRRYRLKRQKD